MPRLLIIYAVMDPATQLTITGLTRFAAYINGTIRAKQTRRLQKEDIDECDILISVRTQDFYESLVIRYAQKQGKLYCLAIDDDFLAIADYKIRRYLQFRALTRSIQTADAILCPNDALGKKLEEESAKGKFVKTDTVVPEDEIYKGNAEEDSELIKIVYYVNDGTLGVYQTVVEPIIKSIYIKYGTKVRWHFIGIQPKPEEDLKKVIVLHDHMGLKEFKALLRNSHFAIGIAPLVDSEFSRGKYINKYIEYTCAGIPGIYSDVEPYSSFIQHGSNGLLTENTDAQWVKCIEAYMDSGLRSRIIENARNVLRKQMSDEAVFGRVIKTYPALQSYRSPDYLDRRKDRLYWKLIKLWGRFVSSFDFVFRAWGRLRCEGIGSLFSYSFKKMFERTTL